jgi:hypothetical protein
VTTWIDATDQLHSALEALDGAKAEARQSLAADPARAGAYAELASLLRELSLADTRRPDPSPKAFARAARDAAPEVRRALALLGSGDGLARGLMKHLALLDLAPGDRMLGALACAQADPEPALAHLEAAVPDSGQALLVALVALGQQPVLDFAEFKSLETLYLGAAPDDPEARDLQRRYDQARSRRAQHARKHLLGLVPGSLVAQPDLGADLLYASLERDPFGTLDHLRESGGAGFCAGLSTHHRLTLLERAAEYGLGLASNHLDLFAIPPDPAWVPRLQNILRRDLTAGATILGVHALEGAHHYPFGLGRIEPVLPRRITSAQALARLKQAEPEDAPARNFSSAELGEASERLQEQEVRRFLEGLKSDLGRERRAAMGVRKRTILFGDPDLRIRDILFLLAQAAFEPEEGFEHLYRQVQKSHPMRAGDEERMLVLANRYYYLDRLGLNPGLLYTRIPRPQGGARTFIEEAGDFPVRALLNAGMSIHLRVGDALFRSMPVAWSMLAGQFQGRIDAVLQELTGLFEGLDTLLTITAAWSSDLEGWLGPLIAALLEDDPELPGETLFSPDRQPFRLATRAILERCRERLNGYCVQALRRGARIKGGSPINVIQGLRLPRSRVDRLRALLDQERKGGKAGR